MSNEGQGTAVATAGRRHMIVESAIPVFDTGNYEHMMRIATVMGRASLIPDHIRGNTEEQTIANCFLITNQAVRWGMDPFAVAQSCFLLHGKLGYEGKLVTAMIESKIGASLDFEWNDEPVGSDKFGIIVRGPRPSDGKIVEIYGTVGDWKTYEKNGNVKANWTGLATRNQLAYRGAREWARLFASGLMLGVYTPDEMDEMDEEFRARNARDISEAPKPERKPRQVKQQGNKFQDGEQASGEGKAPAGEQQQTGTTETVDEDGVVTETETKTEETKPVEEKPVEQKPASEEPPKPAAKKPAAEKKAADKPAEKKAPGGPADIIENFDKVSADVQKRLAGMWALMAAVTTLPGLRDVWQGKDGYMSDVATKPWPVKEDAHFHTVKDFHKARVENIKPADDGFDSGPPKPGAKQEPANDGGAPQGQATPEQWDQFKQDLAAELTSAQDGDEVMEIFNRWTEIGLRDKTISPEQLEGELRPLAMKALDKFTP